MSQEAGSDNGQQALRRALEQRVLILDGAMGTMIQRHQLTEADFRGERFKDHPQDLRGNSDVLVLTRPDVIGAIHREYLAAGADIIETNTFSSTAIAQADYGFESLAYELNVAGARLAREAVDEWNAKTPAQPRFVAGSLGPMNRTLSISPKVDDPSFRGMTFDEARAAYEDQARGLIDGGAHLLLLETIFDTLNAKAGIVAMENVFEEKGVRLPVFISVTITDLSGRTLSGQMIDAFYASIRHARPLAIGMNCALGAREMRPHLEELARLAECYVLCYPNAGLPNAFGQYDQQPNETGELLKSFVTGGLVNIVGGCCGTTPDHIRAIVSEVAGLAARPLPAGSWVLNGEATDEASPEPRTPSPEHYTQFSGLETLTIRPDSNFQMIGERTNVTGSAKFARLIKDNDYTAAVQVAAEQVRNGANLIDVNMDEGMLDSEQAMTTFLCYIATEPEIARVPVMIDSSRWSVIEAGLKCVQGKSVVNSISLKEGEADFLHKARIVQRFGAGVVVMAFDEVGQADTIERKVSICQRAYKILTEQAGLRPDRHHLRSQHPRDCDRSRRAQRLRDQLYRGHSHHQGHVPGREGERWGQQPLVFIPWQRSRPGGHPLGVSVSRHQGRHGHGDRQRRPVDRLRGHPEGPARARRGHHLQPAAGRDRTDGAVRRAGEGSGHEEGSGCGVAAGHCRGAPVATRSSTASSTSSMPMSRKRACSTRGRSRSSRAR